VYERERQRDIQSSEAKVMCDSVAVGQVQKCARKSTNRVERDLSCSLTKKDEEEEERKRTVNE